jgi:hypothetical protein
MITSIKIPAFQQVLLTVVFLTTLSGGAAINLSSQPNLTEAQKQVLGTCTATWQTGIGAIFGLLSSKATETAPSKSESDDDEG